MILIFSTVQDPATLDVIKWIKHLGKAPVLRINHEESEHVELTIVDDTFHLRMRNQSCALTDVTSVWFRKGAFWFRDLFPTVTLDGQNVLTQYLNRKISHENDKLREYFHYLLHRDCDVLGSATLSNPNKLVVLDLARSVGLLTPSFSVSNQRSHAEQRLRAEAGTITKALSDGLYLFDTSETRSGYFTYTEQLTGDRLAELPETMAPSLLQEQIEKALELRIFYMDGACHAMAIHSQNDQQTRVDYRKYNDKAPNRVVPHRLLPEIAAKLDLLFVRLGLNTGSVDMIVDRSGRHYFLEINPVGQFGAISAACNYDIARMIARRLTRHEP